MRQSRAVLSLRMIMMIPLGIMLAGCEEVGMAHRPLEAEMPDRYSVLAPVEAPSRDDIEWWRHFDDPVLDQLVARGLSGNLTAAEARARLREAEADARGDAKRHPDAQIALEHPHDIAGRTPTGDFALHTHV